MIQRSPGHARAAAAALVALAALAGIVIQYVATRSTGHDVGATLWILIRYFTILANAGLVLVFGRAAFSRAGVPPWLLGGAVLCIGLVGVTYGLLLRGLLDLSGGALLADTLLHKVTPVLAPLYWLIFARKGHLHYRDPLIWAIFPALYLPYALLRGAAEGSYAYPFISVAKLGWKKVLVNGAAIGMAFLIAGFAFVWIDRRLKR